MDWKLIKIKLMYWFIGVIIGIICGSTISWARHIDMSKAGVSLWIFLAVGFCIILLQIIPALILFSSFVGYMAKKGFDLFPKSEETPEAEKEKC